MSNYILKIGNLIKKYKGTIILNNINLSFEKGKIYGLIGQNIALALLNSPKILILDEPINGLDPLGIFEVRNLLKKLNSEKDITIIISSHILTELYHLATNYIFLDAGIILETISQENLVQKIETNGNDLENYYFKLLQAKKIEEVN